MKDLEQGLDKKEKEEEEKKKRFWARKAGKDLGTPISHAFKMIHSGTKKLTLQLSLFVWCD